jgi:hypothetical protein
LELSAAFHRTKAVTGEGLSFILRMRTLFEEAFMSFLNKLLLVAVVVLFVGLFYAAGQDLTAPETPAPSAASLEAKKVPAGSRVFVAPMDGGFETYVIAGLQQKKVPLIVVMDRSKADFEISGISESEKAGWAKMLFMGNDLSREQASIKVTNLKTGIVAFAYSVNKGSSARGKQSAGEACAKHIKEKIEGRQD